MMRKNLKKVGLVLAALFLLAAFAGCGRGQEGGASGERQMYQFGGSDSEVNVVQRLTEVFTENNPDVAFAVTGGGSGTGIASLIDGQLDVANSSRPMKEEEIESARDNGIDPRPFVFAQDGLAVIVNSSNPIDDLTVDQIGAIFAGDITDWSEVGGQDGEISLYGRQSTSGTYVYFMENVVKGDYSENKKMQSGNAAIVEGVMADEPGIGYVAIGYAVDSDGSVVDGLKVLKVAKDEGYPAATPLDLDNIMEGLYPIVRPLFHYIDGKPEGGLKDYLEFVVSDEGQKVVQEEGFFPITEEYRQDNSSVFE